MVHVNTRNAWRDTGIKTCPKCMCAKTIREFYIARSGKGIGHPSGYCAACMVSYQKRKRRDPTLYDRVEWPSKIKRLYGITTEQYAGMLEKQEHSCAICKSKVSWSKNYKKKGTSRFMVDHCHETGKVRGLLCTRCNRALGLLGDSIEALLNAAEYLRRHHTQ